MAILDLYGLLVEQLFGGLFLSIIGVVIFMAVIVMISRTSFITGISLIGFFLFICGIYYNVLTLLLLTIGCIWYFGYNLIRLLQGG